MEAMLESEIVARTKSWLEQVVIGLNLCPFAKPVHLRNQIRYRVSLVRTTQGLLDELIQELRHLQNVKPALTETTLLIHPYVLDDFLQYNDFLELADAALEEFEFVGDFQIASFHPQYQFANTKSEDVENFTNRSPFPMLHLLREDSIEKAVASYPDADQIPERNIQTLRALDKQSLKRLGFI